MIYPAGIQIFRVEDGIISSSNFHSGNLGKDVRESTYDEGIFIKVGRKSEVSLGSLVQYEGDNDKILYLSEIGELYVVDFSLSPSTFRNIQLNRDPNDLKFFRNSVIACKGALVYVYERGLVKFDLGFNMLKSISNLYFDDILESFSCKELNYENQHNYSIFTIEI